MEKDNWGVSVLCYHPYFFAVLLSLQLKLFITYASLPDSCGNVRRATVEYGIYSTDHARLTQHEGIIVLFLLVNIISCCYLQCFSVNLHGQFWPVCEGNMAVLLCCVLPCLHLGKIPTNSYLICCLQFMGHNPWVLHRHLFEAGKAIPPHNQL